MKYVGIKQVVKAIKEGKNLKVFVADDAEPHVTANLLELCSRKGIQVSHVEKMSELGKEAGISVGASALAIEE